jgi:excisionase family DNA binding protein
LTETSQKHRDFENYISQVEAARIRGVSKQAIADLVKRGRLTSVKIAGRTLLLRSEVEAFVALPKLGRPPKKSTPKKKSKAFKATSLKK